PQDAIGSRAKDLTLGADPSTIDEELRCAIRAGYRISLSVIRTDKTGNIRHKLRNQWGIIEDARLVIIRDITDLKRAEEALRKSELQFRRCFEMGPIGVTITSPQRTWFEANQRFCEMLGYSCEELLQKSWDQVTHPDDLERDLEESRRVMAGEKDNYQL